MLERLGPILALMAVGLAQNAGLPADPPRPVAGGDWRVSVRDFAQKNFRNPAWGYSHSVRDYDLAGRLAAADHVAVDDDVLFAAAFLHDMAAFKPWEDEKADHADVAADLMASTLKDTGFPMDKLDAVRAAIRTHMFEREPVSPEARYLHDADALDWLGAIGVARVVALADPNGGDPDGPTVVKMLEDNLRQVPSRVVSSAGRQIMNARREELQRFLRELRDETDQLRSL
jgi:HD superfamily phosphodiesterase